MAEKIEKRIEALEDDNTNIMVELRDMDKRIKEVEK